MLSSCGQWRRWSDWADARLICVFAGCTCYFVGFLLRWLKLTKRKRTERSCGLRSFKSNICAQLLNNKRCSILSEDCSGTTHEPPHDKTNKMVCVPSDDSDQTGQMSRLIWVFAGHTVILLVLSWGGILCESNHEKTCVRRCATKTQTDLLSFRR